MSRQQSGQALVEWAVVSFVLLLLALGILALGQVIGQYMAVRSASSQAAFAAARATSGSDAQVEAIRAAQQAISGSGVQGFNVSIDTRSFQRGGTLSVDAEGDVNLASYPIVSQVLGSRLHLRWVSSALIEPYRSRAP